jgi:hypothetical protein
VIAEVFEFRPCVFSGRNGANPIGRRPRVVATAVDYRCVHLLNEALLSVMAHE